MDERATGQIAQAVNNAVAPLVRRLEDIETALWGDADSRRRETDPGIVSVVAELYKDLQKRRTILGFLSAVVSIVGFTNVVTLIVLVGQLGGSP